VSSFIAYDTGAGGSTETRGHVTVRDTVSHNSQDARREAQIPLRRLPRNFGKDGVMEFGLKGTSRDCRGRHGEVGIVEFGCERV